MSVLQLPKTRSAFNAWIQLQYGPRPSVAKENKLREQLRRARREVESLEDQLAAIELYRERETAARQGWMAARNTP